MSVGVSNKDAAELQQLNDLFFSLLGANVDGSVAKSVIVACPK